MLNLSVSTVSHRVNTRALTVWLQRRRVITPSSQTRSALTAWWALGPLGLKRAITQPLESKRPARADTLKCKAHETYTRLSCSVLNDPRERGCLIIVEDNRLNCCLLLYIYHWYTASITASVCSISILFFSLCFCIYDLFIGRSGVGLHKVCLNPRDVEHLQLKDETCLERIRRDMLKVFCYFHPPTEMLCLSGACSVHPCNEFCVAKQMKW